MNIKLAILYFFFGFVVLQYQNCAPAPNVDGNIEGALAQDQVGVINPVVTGEIAFPQQKLSIPFEERLRAYGLCEQSGAKISWRLFAPNGEPVEQGLSECDQGTFVVDASETWKEFCDETFTLKAMLGAKASSEVQVETLCPN